MHFSGMEYNDGERPQVHCLECGDEIGYGRPDRKFCSDKCRNRYHNRRNNPVSSARIKALNAIEKNYGILTTMLACGVSSASLTELEAAGFNPSSCSSCARCGCHLELRCFDLSYLMSSSRIFRLKKAGPEWVGRKK